MSVIRPFRHPRLWFALWLAMIAAVMYGSLLPAGDLPEPLFPGVDKLQHLLGYAALAGYAVMLFERARAHALAALAMLLLGVAIEFMQGALTESRSADAADALANGIGVFAGWALRFTRARDLLQAIDARAAKRIDRTGD